MPDKIRIEPKIDTPINDLAWSLNHYMSLADHLGVIIGHETDDAWVVYVPVNQEMKQDQENFSALRARLSELDVPHTLRQKYNNDQFDFWTLRVSKEHIETLSQALRDQPGPRGWGSTHDVLRQRDILNDDGTINEDVLP